MNVTDRRQFLYATVASETLRADVVVGDESTSELIRLGTCRLEAVT